jgi:hypothetical protein
MLEEVLDQQKNWQELMQRVYQDKITGEQAYEIGYPWVQKEDALVAEAYADKKDLILKLSSNIIEKIDTVVHNNYYKNCRRGFFGAIAIDLNNATVITSPGFNMPGPTMLDMCRIADNICTREIGTPKHGSGYDLCPACHAREQLSICNNISYNTIWVEGGAVLKNNKLEHWDLYNSHPYHIYPCQRCLNYSLCQKIDTLAALKYTGKWEISFHDVEAHARLLLIYNILKNNKTNNH